MVDHVFRNFWFRKFFLVLSTAILYYVFARLSLMLQFQISNATPVWIPSGFAFAAMLLCGRQIMPGILAGAFLANFTVFISNQATSLPSAILLSLFIAAGNTGEAVAGNYLLRKMIRYQHLQEIFSTVKNLFRFAFTTAIMCMVSSITGASAVFFSGVISYANYSLVLITWWLGDFSSILLITPLLLVWIQSIQNRTLVINNYTRFAESAVLFVIAIIGSGIIFDDWFSAPHVFHWAYWIIPVLVWAAIRFSQRSTITIIALCSAIAIWGTINRAGPFSSLSLNESLLTVQAFISIMVITKLSLNASINERRQYEADLIEARNELEMRVEKRTADLSKKNEELASFAYVASHDLQEPLRKIQAFAERIRGKVVMDQEGLNYFNRIENAAARMQNLIEDLLSYSRTTTEAKNFVETDLNTILEEVKDDLREKINASGAEIISERLPQTEVIPFQFRQLFTNLISNSIKFAQPGIVPQIKINSRMEQNLKSNGTIALPSENYFVITVRDNGIGFEPQYNQQIFGIFQRLHGKNEYAGTGIGLSIVKKIVENHNGIITAESELNKGALFSIYLPVKE